MLNVEQGSKGTSPSQGTPLTYGDYLRVPELLTLQSPLSNPLVHDEMLFIILQQIQELWFKQVLFELEDAIALLEKGSVLQAVKRLQLVNSIMKAINNEVEVMELLPPQEFLRFRHVLSSSSGFESEQFRELELASGLAEPTFLALMQKHMNMAAIKARWPVTLRGAFLKIVRPLDDDPATALALVYKHADAQADLYLLAEVLSEYDVLFAEWRFHHMKVVERTIGDRLPGTAGSSGAGYLGKTLGYRFFPELWEARNQIASLPADR